MIIHFANELGYALTVVVKVVISSSHVLDAEEV